MAPPPPDREDPVISNAQHGNEDCEVTSKDKEISSLMESIQRLQSSLNHLRESSASQIRLLEEQLDKKQEIISRLEAQLDSRRDYEEIQRELIILKGHTGTDSSVTVNGFDTKDSKEKRTGSPACSLNPRYMLDHPSIPVDAIGSILSEELAANWRRSLERTLLSGSPPIQHQVNPGNTPLHHGNDSSSPLPQHSPLGDTNLNDSSGNMDRMSLLNGNMSGSNERIPFRFEDSLIPKSDPMEARLQEMLRYNMDKFGSQCLDTLHIARRVRELLSIHNIGQRLFAKYVLGLSQGTVSELLSKPKPWDKLTEKGRDSYRKMHAWAADEASVLLLKSLIPKKGKEGPTGALPSFRTEESGAEDRIAHILSEANHVLQRNQFGGVGMSYDSVCDDNAGNSDDKSPSSNNNGCNNNGQGPPSPSSSSSRDRRLRKYENDDISQEQLARIYQEQLAKHILSHGVQDAEPRLPTDAFQSMIFPHLFGGSLLETEEIRMLLDAYHRGFSKFAASTSSSPHFRPVVFPSNATTAVNGISSAQDLSLPKRPSPDLNNDNDEQVESDDPSDSVRQVASAFSLVRPKGGDASGGSGAPSPLDSILHPSGDDSSNASPLQRMASITNSLISQPTTPTVSSPNQRPLKAVLPPITQQQFDQYNNLNTEDIVRKVKEQLSQYSISQRLFGESVLGLSQGSVSDLLARPKPWHMLTQKGREPFIRMKMFLEDDNAVHKLVASQYKIAPEKLMRTGGYSGNLSGNPSPTSGNPKPPPKPIETPKTMETSPLPIQPTLISPVPVPHDIVKKSPISHGRTATSPVLNMRSTPGCLPQQPSVYEMAALTQDLDTQLITTKIKEALLANNIGQKIFGEVVLGLSQGSVSELLSKPKPWHMLSIKGREPFIRMQLWLADPLNIERLQHLKNERREANKRKRGLTHGGTNMDSYTSGTQGSSDASNDSPNESYSPGSGSTVPPSKKQRVLFTDEQKEALKLAFSLDSYPNVSAIEFLGRELGLSSRTITNWFHNHRMRLKQQTSNPLMQESPVSSQPFDPIQFRLLLHQRLIEMHKYNSLPLYGVHNKNLSDEGLDLTVSNNASRLPSDSDDDDFDDAHEDDGSSDDGDSTTSTGSKDLTRKRKAIRKLGLNLACGTPRPIKFCGGTSGSSRRKPVAPQWLNPSWHDDSDDDEVLINGVCVVQNSLNYEKYVKKNMEVSSNNPVSLKSKMKSKEIEPEIKNEGSNGKRSEDRKLYREKETSHLLKTEVDYPSENDCSE